jgi:transcriptional regulator with XRE-family HTH domain
LELAVKSGVSLFVISGIETGRNVNPYYSAILKLAAALGVRPDEIMYREMPGSAA